jgi:nucleoside-diphosphate-sugar epimerase
MSNKDGYFVTGGLGCIGAWVIRNLVQEGNPVAVFDLGNDLHRLKPIMTDEEINKVKFINADITDINVVEKSLKESEAKHIIHLAALQVPACMQNPVLGAQVNVVGTVNLYEAAARLGYKRVVFASSVAVYGFKDDYPAGLLPHDASLKPRTHYGVYKQANEGTAKIYQDKLISSIGLRPYVVYGPGRDQGISSFPTQAMLAAVTGKEFQIPFSGRSAMQYVDDVAKIFIMATKIDFQGFEMFNIKGRIVDMAEIVAAIEKAEPSAKGKITFSPNVMPTIEGLEDKVLIEKFGPIPNLPFDQGVADTMAIMKKALASGRM